MAFPDNGTLDQFVLNPLVIPLTVVMLDALRNRPPEMAFAKWDHAVEALILDRAHEPFGRIIRKFGRAIRRLDSSSEGAHQAVGGSG